MKFSRNAQMDIRVISREKATLRQEYLTDLNLWDRCRIGPERIDTLVEEGVLRFDGWENHGHGGRRYFLTNQD